MTVPPGGGTTSTEIVFATDSLASQAVTGIYIQAMNTNLTLLNGIGAYLGLSADELVITTANPNENQFYLNALGQNNTIVFNNIWKSGYANIYHINACIEQLTNSKNITDTLRTRLLGESKLMRALTYFYLVNLFGGVPLVTGTSMDINSTMSRSADSIVYSKIILPDLLDAYSQLPDANDNTRPSKQAAAALLARVYCYKQNWLNAAMYSNLVIKDARRQLATNLNNVFLSNSSETIFQLSPVLANNSTSEGFNFIPSSSAVVPKFFMSTPLLSAFETGDMRRIAWVKTNVVRGTSYSFPNKYKIKTSNNPPVEYNIVLRLAEQYLIHAEATANENYLDSATIDINIIRNRAGLPSILPTSQVECFKAIGQERRIELFAEWGHRWLDLKRTYAIDTVMPPISIMKGGAWSTTSKLFPIPLSEIQLDPNLIQNPGY